MADEKICGSERQEHVGKKDSNKNKSYRVFGLKAAPLIVDDGCPPLSASGPISGLLSYRLHAFESADLPQDNIPIHAQKEKMPLYRCT